MTTEQRLAGCHPELVKKVKAVLAEMKSLGHPMIVIDGLRTTAQQQALYAQGRTKSGNIVTNADGVRTRSNHQAHTDGFGHAADCCFVVKGRPSWDIHNPWSAYGERCVNHHLMWGGNFHTIHDLPHCELP